MAWLIVLLLILEKIVFGLAKGDFNFTSEPNDKTLFVGNGKKSEIFKWTYSAKIKTDLKRIQFGYVDGDEYYSVVVKEFQQGQFHLVKIHSDDNSRKNRMIAAEDAEAKFTFKNLQLNDSGKYFCGIKYSFYPIQHSVVELRVEDLEIDKASSSNSVEGWIDHQMKLRCVVNVAEGVTPIFEWRKQSDGTLVNARAKQRNDERSSTLHLFPHFKEEFDNYVCVARTKRTTKNHTVIIRRLYKPEAPVILRDSKTFDQDIVYPKIHWTEPENGGSPIEKYIVEFKPVGIPWSKATKEFVNLTVYLMNKIRPGRSYDVRVFAKSKVGISIPSKTLAVKYKNGPKRSRSGAGRWTSNVASIIFNGISIYLGIYLFGMHLIL